MPPTRALALPPAPCRLPSAPPGLTWLDLSRNELAALPAALAGATALAGLELEGNPLLISEADASLLAALPALRHVQLDFERFFHSDAAMALLAPFKVGLVVEQAPDRRSPPESESEGGEGWSSGDEEPW